MEILEIEEVQTAPKTELAPIERAALALESSKTEQHLMALATKHQSITVVKDKAGREQAHGAYMEVMRARTAVDKAAKDAREDATKFSKAVIAEAARLVAIVEPEEARLKEARDAWDAEQARIKAEAEARERARVLAITERIAAIKSYVVLANNCRAAARIQELQDKLAYLSMEGFEEFEAEALAAMQWASGKVEEILACKLGEEATAAAEKAEQERVKAEQKAEAEKLAFQRRLMEEERAAIQADLDAKAAMQREEQDRLKAEADAAEAKVRAAAEALALERAEFERQKAELEAKAKPVEQVEPMLTEAARLVDMVSGVGGSDEKFDGPFFPFTDKAPEPEPVASEAPMAANWVGARAPVASAIVLAVAEIQLHPNGAPMYSTTTFRDDGKPIMLDESGRRSVFCDVDEEPTNDAPRAPVASAIVLAVAEFWSTDNKTAARWITERAAEIESLQ